MDLKFLAIFVLVASTSSSILNKQNSVKCKNRRVDFTLGGVNYFYNGFLEDTFDKRVVSWTRAREVCKSYCSDLMSIDTQQEFEQMKKFLEGNAVDYLWTSGHVCERNQCDEKSQPISINARRMFAAGSGPRKGARRLGGKFYCEQNDAFIAGYGLNNSP
jgi:hypothetical protein